jgi:hypothetical protein
MEQPYGQRSNPPYLEGESLPAHLSLVRNALREALSIIHTWVKAQRFHSSLGFYSATNPVLGGQSLLLADSFPSHIPGQTTTLVEAFAWYNLQFEARWYDAALSPYDPTWKSQPPEDQFVQAPKPLVEIKTEPGVLST